MPKLWSDTIETHRRQVRDAILEAAVTLVTEHGLHAVAMSQVAEAAGIGRATLYKYFPDVEAILIAWHGDQVNGHLEHLQEVRGRAGDPVARLHAVLEAYAFTVFDRPRHSELAAFVHRGRDLADAQRHLVDFISHLLTEAAQTGHIRDDVGAGELATFCLNALAASGSLHSKAAVRRLVGVTLAGLRPAH